MCLFVMIHFFPITDVLVKVFNRFILFLDILQRPTETNQLTKDCNNTVAGNIENESEKDSRFHSSDIVINFAPSLV